MRGLLLTQRFPYLVGNEQGALYVEYTAEIDAYVRSSPLPVIMKPRDDPKVLKPSVSPDCAIGHLASLTSNF